MDTLAFTDRSFRVAPEGQTVVCDTFAARADLDALRDALAWRRARLQAATFDDAAEVLVLRDLVALDDHLADAAATGSPAPLTVSAERARLLCELAGSYVAARDVDGHRPLEERNRIARLRELSGRLMDACSDLAGAEAEARARALIA